MDISLVIPVYNERHRLPDTLTAVINYLETRFAESEVIIVEDGSEEDVGEYIRSLPRNGKVEIRYLVHRPNRGKGFSAIRGLLEAKGELAGYVDADGATPIFEMDRLLSAVRGGADAALGSRAVKGEGVKVEKSLHRFVMGRIFAFIVNAVTGLRFLDTQCGFKLFRTSKFREVFREQKTEGFAFDVEILMRAEKKGLDVREVAVNWVDVAGSKVRLFGDSFRMLKDVLSISKMNLGEGKDAR